MGPDFAPWILRSLRKVSRGEFVRREKSIFEDSIGFFAVLREFEQVCIKMIPAFVNYQFK